jgi:hypothetical protein
MIVVLTVVAIVSVMTRPASKAVAFCCPLHFVVRVWVPALAGAWSSTCIVLCDVISVVAGFMVSVTCGVLCDWQSIGPVPAVQGSQARVYRRIERY